MLETRAKSNTSSRDGQLMPTKALSGPEVRDWPFHFTPFGESDIHHNFDLHLSLCSFGAAGVNVRVSEFLSTG